MSKIIGVLGCGWLGLPLAVSLVKKGYKVRGTSTSEIKLSHINSLGIEAFLISLGTESIEGPIAEFLHDLDILIVNVPPAMRSNPQSSYLDKMVRLNKAISEAGLKHLVFVSSTSVYGNREGEVTEETEVMPVSKSARQLVQSEELFFRNPDMKSTIVRFGGLIGPDRHPVKQLSGKSDLTNGDDAVNLIHLDDCIQMIVAIIENGWWDEIFNGVYPDHPSKAEYYDTEALKRGLEPPSYKGLSGVRKGKIIESRNFLIKNGIFYTSIHS